MFKKFAERIDYAHLPIKGRVDNIGLYQNLCELVRHEITQDQELLNQHEKRLDVNCYRDKDYNVLTQDFIYAVAQHFDDIEIQIPGETKPQLFVELYNKETNKREIARVIKPLRRVVEVFWQNMNEESEHSSSTQMYKKQFDEANCIVAGTSVYNRE